MKAGVLGKGVVIVSPALLLEYWDCRVGANIVFARCTECRTYYYEHSACARIGSAVGLGHGNDTRSPIAPMHVEKRQARRYFRATREAGDRPEPRAPSTRPCACRAMRQPRAARAKRRRRCRRLLRPARRAFRLSPSA